MSLPRIWVIPNNRPGDDAQVYALAEELGLPFETRTMAYNWRFWLGGRYMGASASSVVDHVRERMLVPPWPDLILMVGRRAVPVGRWVQKQNGGRTRLVLIGHPRVDPNQLDLVYTTRQYRTPDAPSMRLLPVAMSRYRKPLDPLAEEKAWLEALPRPHLLMMLGGETRHWTMRPRTMAAHAAKLAHRAFKAGGSLIVVRSARTTEEVLDAIEDTLQEARCEWRVVRHDFPRFPVLMQGADQLFPTADSISMISESVIAGKPVGIVPVEMKPFAWLLLGSERRMERNRRRDLRRFWAFIRNHKLAGTIEQPLAGSVANPVFEAAREVRALLEQSFCKLPR